MDHPARPVAVGRPAHRDRDAMDRRARAAAVDLRSPPQHRRLPRPSRGRPRATNQRLLALLSLGFYLLSIPSVQSRWARIYPHLIGLAAGVKMRSAVARARPAADPTSALDPGDAMPHAGGATPQAGGGGPHAGGGPPQTPGRGGSGGPQPGGGGGGPHGGMKMVAVMAPIASPAAPLAIATPTGWRCSSDERRGTSIPCSAPVCECIRAATSLVLSVSRPIHRRVGPSDSSSPVTLPPRCKRLLQRPTLGGKPEANLKKAGRLILPGA